MMSSTISSTSWARHAAKGSRPLTAALTRNPAPPQTESGELPGGGFILHDERSGLSIAPSA